MDSTKFLEHSLGNSVHAVTIASRSSCRFNVASLPLHLIPKVLYCNETCGLFRPLQ
uniref:Uncharacterized protein n=1 Tax=Anguilla anguilla TaxID=7936 RepID=A0A0E9WFS1_ANGAN